MTFARVDDLHGGSLSGRYCSGTRRHRGRKAVQTNVSVRVLSAPLFLVLVHPAQLGVFLLHSYSAKQVRRSFGQQCDSSCPE